MKFDSRPLKFLIGFSLVIFYFGAIRGVGTVNTAVALFCIQAVLSIGIGAVWLGKYRYGTEPDSMRETLGVACLSLAFSAGVIVFNLERMPVTVGHAVVMVAAVLVALCLAGPLGKMWSHLGGEPLKTDDTAPARFLSKLPLRAVVKVRSDEGTSSGFLIGSDGILVTSAHGIHGAKSISVMLMNGENYPAELIVLSKGMDLALLKIEPAHLLPAARLADSTDLTIGARCLFLGIEPDRFISDFEWGMQEGRHSIPLREPAVIPGTLSAITDAEEEGSAASLVVAAHRTVRPGYSGAAIVDAESGLVIGVHSGSLPSPGLMRAASSEMVRALLKEARVEARRSLFFRLPKPVDGPALGRVWDGSAYQLHSQQARRIKSGWNPPDPADWQEWRDYVQQFIDEIPDHPSCVACRAGFAFLDGKPEEGLDLIEQTLQFGFADVAVSTLDAWIENGGERVQATALVERSFAEEPILLGVDSYRVSTIAEFLVRHFFVLRQYERVLDVVKRVRQVAEKEGEEAEVLMAEGRALLNLDRYTEAVTALEAARDYARHKSQSMDAWSPLIEAYLRVAESQGDEAQSDRDENLTKAARLGLWHMLHRPPDRKALDLAAEAAEKLGKPNLAALLREMESLDLDD